MFITVGESIVWFSLCNLSLWHKENKLGALVSQGRGETDSKTSWQRFLYFLQKIINFRWCPQKNFISGPVPLTPCHHNRRWEVNLQMRTQTAIKNLTEHLIILSLSNTTLAFCGQLSSFIIYSLVFISFLSSPGIHFTGSLLWEQKRLPDWSPTVIGCHSGHTISSQSHWLLIFIRDQ